MQELTIVTNRAKFANKMLEKATLSIMSCTNRRAQSITVQKLARTAEKVPKSMSLRGAKRRGNPFSINSNGFI